MKRLLLMGLATLALTGGAAVGAVQPNDPVWAEQLGARQIGLPQVWETTTGDPGVLIATVDTGANGIPDLEGALVPGYDFVDNDFEPQDTHDGSHGTRVASVLAARGNNGIGMAGHCWGCRVLPVRVSANGSATPARIAVGIRYAVDRGARIINVSLSHPGNPDEAEAAAVQYAISRGVIVVASAGNAGTEALQYPGAYPGVLAVGASDDLDDLYFWSTRGAWVSLTAPGCQMVDRRVDPAGDDLRHVLHTGRRLRRRRTDPLAQPVAHRKPGRDRDGRDRAPRQGRRLRAGRPGGRLSVARPAGRRSGDDGRVTAVARHPADDVAARAATHSRPAVHTTDAVRDGHVQAGVPLDVSGRAWALRDAAADAARVRVLPLPQQGGRAHRGSACRSRT